MSVRGAPVAAIRVVHRLVPATTRARRLTAHMALALAIVGLVAFVRGGVIDLIVGLRAAKPHAMAELYDQIGDAPTLLPAALYNVGPLLFEVAWPRSSSSWLRCARGSSRSGARPCSCSARCSSGSIWTFCPWAARFSGSRWRRWPLQTNRKRRQLR